MPINGMTCLFFPPFVRVRVHIHCPSPTETFYLSFKMALLLPCSRYTHTHTLLQYPIEDLFQFINHAIIQYFFLLYIIIYYLCHMNMVCASFLLRRCKKESAGRIFPSFCRRFFACNSMKFMTPASNMDYVKDDW